MTNFTLVPFALRLKVVCWRAFRFRHHVCLRGNKELSVVRLRASATQCLRLHFGYVYLEVHSKYDSTSKANACGELYQNIK